MNLFQPGYIKMRLALLAGALILLQLPGYTQLANVTIDIPAPHGGDLGMVGGGFAFQSRTRNTEKGFNPDGNVGLYFGFGDTQRLVGLTLGTNIFGISNKIGEEGNFGAGSLDVQVNRMINPYISVGVGARNLSNWDNQQNIARINRSFFATSSFIVPLHRRYDESFSLLFITAGIGNGMFRLDKDFSPKNSGNFSPFGSVALQVLRSTNAIVEWNGYELSAGISAYPFKKIPSLGGTLSLTDLTEKRTRMVLSVGYFFNMFDNR